MLYFHTDEYLEAVRAVVEAIWTLPSVPLSGKIAEDISHGGQI